MGNQTRKGKYNFHKKKVQGYRLERNRIFECRSRKEGGWGLRIKIHFFYICISHS
jgi:hypothetical protein